MKIRRLLFAAVATIMVGVNIIDGFLPVMAADSDPTVINPDPVTLDDGVVLSKTAVSSTGYANEWVVTLRIEAPIIKVTSDTVLVIDSSYSMRGEPLAEAKAAAKTLAAELLPESNKTSHINRVAVVSYDQSAHDIIGFSYDGAEVSDAIDTITEEHGTFTQGGLHEAVGLIAGSDATYKNIVLLSDGEPNYSCGISNLNNHLNDYFQEGGPGRQLHERETIKSIPESAFNDCASKVGAAQSSMYTQYTTTGSGNNRTYYYYNHGNSAIAEALNYQSSDNGGNLYAIMFETGAGDNGADVLRAMTSNFYNPTVGGLEAIFRDIAGEISEMVKTTHVHDVMGEGVLVEDAEHGEPAQNPDDLDWDPEFECDETKCVASYSYVVEAGEHILDPNSDIPDDIPEGFHPLNKDATLRYVDKDGNEKEGHFPVPYVKPFYVNVKKELEGQTCDEGQCIFTFKFHHPSGEKDTEYTVEAGKLHSIIERFPIGDYTLTEIGTNVENPVEFENYLISYTVDGVSGNTFTINEQHEDHINVTIENEYKTVDLSASKVWNDGDDQDGLREDYDDFWVVVKDDEGNYADMEELELVGDEEQPYSYNFENLPKNRNGSEIVYSVVEASGCEKDSNSVITCEKEFDGNNGEVSIDEDYTMQVGANNVITNKHTPATVKIIVNKDWDDEENRDGLRADNNPVEFCVTGKVGNETVYEKTCKTASSLLEDIEIEFTGLPKYYDGGQVIKYEVEESEFLGYAPTGLPEEAFAVEDEEDVDVTNVHTPEKISVLIQKVWDDGDNNDNTRPEQITGTLTGGDKDVPVTIKQSNKVEGECDEWCIELTGLYKNKQGQAIEYSLSEDEVTGYTTEITGDAENGFTITNSYSLETVTVSVDKSWSDENNRDGLRTDNSTVTFCVTGYTDNYTSTPVCKTVLTGVGLKTDVVTFEGLLKYHDGDEINYEVTEVDVLDGYASDLVAGEYVVITDDMGTQEVTNTHEAEKISILIQKIWDDEDNKDELRPDEISVTVTGGEEDINLTITENDKVDGKCESWCTEITDLYKNYQGQAIEYKVSEKTVAEYETEVTGDVESGFIITNSHTPEPEPEPVDPCEKGGCGGIDTTTALAPETGALIKNENGNATETMWINNVIGGAMMVVLGASLFTTIAHRKSAKSTK